jgi:hypothetical protein
MPTYNEVSKPLVQSIQIQNPIETNKKRKWEMNNKTIETSNPKKPRNN